MLWGFAAANDVVQQQPYHRVCSRSSQYVEQEHILSLRRSTGSCKLCSLKCHSCTILKYREEEYGVAIATESKNWQKQIGKKRVKGEHNSCSNNSSINSSNQEQQQQQQQQQHCRGQNSRHEGMSPAAMATFSSSFLAPPAHVGSHEEAPPADPPWDPDPVSPPLPNRPPKVPPCCLEGLPRCLDGLTGSSSAIQEQPEPTC